MIRFGIDLGGTKTEIIALDSSGAERLRHRVPTPKEDYSGILHTIVGLVHRAERELGARGTIGVGTPGAVSRATGRLRNSNTPCLNGQPLLQDLQDALQRPVRMENDANCFALSEATDGAGAGCVVVFGVIVGTGTGGGIAVHGRVLTGVNAIAGEWGHNPLPWPDDDERPGPVCYCGRRGCIETFLSGPGLTEDHYRASGARLAPPEIAARADRGDRGARQTLDRYAARMARALAHVINLLDPDVIVLGGGLSNLEYLYAAVPRLWQPYVFSDRVDNRLLAPRHGDSSGARGAAWLW